MRVETSGRSDIKSDTPQSRAGGGQPYRHRWTPRPNLDPIHQHGKGANSHEYVRGWVRLGAISHGGYRPLRLPADAVSHLPQLYG